MPSRVAILTIADLGAAGKREDTSGGAIAAWATGAGHTVAAREIVPDETDRIAAVVCRWAGDGAADLIVTTGGARPSSRDVDTRGTEAGDRAQVAGIAGAEPPTWPRPAP